MLIQHTSPLGVLHVPALGVDVAPGEPIDVPESLAGPLLEQVDLWHAVKEI